MLPIDEPKFRGKYLGDRTSFGYPRSLSVPLRLGRSASWTSQRPSSSAGSCCRSTIWEKSPLGQHKHHCVLADGLVNAFRKAIKSLFSVAVSVMGYARELPRPYSSSSTASSSVATLPSCI